ncbi:MAG TPA: GNAT family N-acetyltransferase [Anaerolineales bacterium]|nr:GNAT family N-acetyltransferase [Anaerolineales bacterium]
MNHIQADMSDEALVTAIRNNMCDFFRHVSRSDLQEHFESQQFTRWHSPLPHPWFNGVLSSRAYEEGDDAFIEATIQYFREKGILSFTWWMEPHVSPPAWEQIQSRHGFRYSNDTPGMAIDLNDLNDSPRLLEGFEIRVVNDEETLHAWVKTFIHGYGLPSHWESLTFDLWVQLGLDLPIRNYLGYLNAEPVSTSTVFYGEDVAGIYCVSTLHEARGKGIGAALTLQPLQEARDLGYRVGVLQSSDMGFNVYKRLGFRHLCQIEYYYLSMQSAI